MDNYTTFSKFLEVCKANNLEYIQDFKLMQGRKQAATIYEISGKLSNKTKEQFLSIRAGVSLIKIGSQYAPELNRNAVKILTNAELKRQK